jgi:hypothetical protein
MFKPPPHEIPLMFVVNYIVTSARVRDLADYTNRLRH